MQLTRRTFVGSALGTAAAMGLAACGATGGGNAAASGEKALTGTYAIHVGGYDWGPGVDKAIITLDAPLSSGSDSFTVARAEFTFTIAESMFVPLANSSIT